MLRDQSGYTFAEVILGIMLLSAAVVLLAGSFSAGSEGAASAVYRFRQNARLLCIDSALRNISARVQPPFFARTVRAGGEEECAVPGDLVFAWVDGRENGFLTLSIVGDDEPGLGETLLVIRRVNGEKEMESRFQLPRGWKAQVSFLDEEEMVCLQLVGEYGGMYEIRTAFGGRTLDAWGGR